jgi:Dolichyl-phosphate-mannose-protein mannosyltransferase
VQHSAGHGTAAEPVLQAPWSMRHCHHLLLAGCVTVYLCLAAFSAVNKIPWCDEGWYGAPAHELALHGRMGTPNLYGLQGVQQHTYWEMPGFIVSLAAWFRLVGFGLMQARALNCLLGLACILLWYGILRKLDADAKTAILAATLTGIDSFFLIDATLVRADMLGLTLQSGAYLVYLKLRAAHFDAAVGWAFTAAVAAGLTHPNAGLLGLIGLTVMMTRDYRKLRIRHLFIAATPFIAGGLAWGAYILLAPADFVSQFSQNSRGRFHAIFQPLAAIRDEIGRRYLQGFGLGAHSYGTPRTVVLKSVVLAGYAAAAGYCTISYFRNRQVGRAAEVLVPIFLGYLFFFTFLEGTRTTYYLTFIVPLFCAFVAIAVVRAVKQGAAVRWTALAFLAAVIAVQMGYTAAVAIRGRYMQGFHQVSEYISRTGGTGPGTIASSEMGYAFGFVQGRYSDDETFGELSGVRPNRIVISPRFFEEVVRAGAGAKPSLIRARRFLDESCRLTYNQNSYQVYECAQ